MSRLEDTLAEQMRWAGLPEPTREFRFHPTRRWRLDFYWCGPEVAVEVDGGTRGMQGRHVRGDGYERDCEKLNEAQLAGIAVLRVTSAMVQDGRALLLIQRALGVATA